MPLPTPGEVIGLFTAALVSWNLYRQNKQKNALEAQREVVDQIHILTNSAMGKELLDKLELLQAMSVLAHQISRDGTEASQAAAAAIDVRVTSAKNEYNQHQINQATVDAKVDVATK